MLSSYRQVVVTALLTLWFAAMSFVCSTLMIGHWVQLPTPKVGSRQPFATDSDTSVSLKWRALHFLSSECVCSQRILKHLLQREPLSDIEEKIIIVGGLDATRELVAGSRFAIDWTSPEELKSKYGVEAAPLLVVLDSDETIRYSGAYTARKQAYPIQDVLLIKRALAGESIQSLPLFGCGVSGEMQSLTDPLGLKKKLSR